jgi:hypothetical protein
MYALLYPRDEIELPHAALDLPGTQRHEQNKEQHGQSARDCQEHPGTPTAAATGSVTGIRATRAHAVSVPNDARRVAGRPLRIATRFHGMLCIFIIESGIILLLR